MLYRSARWIPTTCLLFVASWSFGQSTIPRRFELKAGVVTYIRHTEDLKGVSESRIVVSFDNFGEIEREDFFVDSTMVESYLSDGNSAYDIDHRKQETMIIPFATRMTDHRFNWATVPVADKNSGAAKELPDCTIAGKHCTSYSISSAASNSAVILAGWKGIYLLRELKSESSVIRDRAVSVEELDGVPAAVLTPPADYRLLEP